MTDHNPYEAPVTPTAPDAPVVVGQPIRVSLGHAPRWIVTGYRLFAGAWPTWVLIMSIFLGVFMLLQLLVVATSSFLLGEILGSLVLLPLLVGGIVMGFHWLAQDQPLPVFSLFAGFVTRPVALIGGGLAAYFLMVLVLAFAMTMSGLGIQEYLLLIQGQDEAKIVEIISSPAFLKFLGWIGPLMLPATVIYYFTVSQIALSNIPVIQALGNSFRAVFANLHVLLLGFVVLFFIAVALALIASTLFAVLALVPIDEQSAAGKLLYTLVLTVAIGAPAAGCMFGINYAAFRDIFMHVDIPDAQPGD